MDSFKTSIEAFFDNYRARFNASLQGAEVDVDGTVDSFSDCFIEASPVGINCGKNDKSFRKKIPKGYEFYKKIGTRSMLIEKREVTQLDDLHALVKITWRSEYNRKNDSMLTLDFDVFYLVQNTEQGIKIFAYITGDEQKLLKENGLI